MMLFKIRYEMRAGPVAPHIRCSLFCAPAANQTYVLLGNFTMRPNEFEALKQAFEQAEFEAMETRSLEKA